MNKSRFCDRLSKKAPFLSIFSVANIMKISCQMLEK